jgi:hsp70-interacting protein
MADKGLNDLLKWSIENQDLKAEDGAAAAPSGRSPSGLTPDAIAALFGGGPSDAELMISSMEAIHNPEVSLEHKLIAFDNFEQLIESLDNANNMANMSLWTPLLDCLAHEEHDIRRMAAWCVGTAVQNNAPSQERLFAMGGVPKLIGIAANADEKEPVRRKALYALSSAVRNYQPALDVCVEELSKKGIETGKADAENMDSVDAIIEAIKAKYGTA